MIHVLIHVKRSKIMAVMVQPLKRNPYFGSSNFKTKKKDETGAFQASSETQGQLVGAGKSKQE